MITKIILQKKVAVFKITATIIACVTICYLQSCNKHHKAISNSYKKMNPVEKQLASGLLLKALDHEALYTLMDTLKPMSSVQYYRMPLYSINEQQKDSAQQAVEIIQKVINKLSVGDFQFVLNPFEKPDSIYRNMEVYVFRKSSLKKVLRKYADFYYKWGLSPNANAATVLAITEYEKKYDRWRSYGYLFGYPDYAVDFFVSAGMQQDSTKEFVKRDFFQIPVYTNSAGHFTYAMPKGFVPSQTDSSIYNKAMVTLLKYKRIREKFASKEKLNTVKILKKIK